MNRTVGREGDDRPVVGVAVARRDGGTRDAPHSRRDRMHRTVLVVSSGAALGSSPLSGSSAVADRMRMSLDATTSAPQTPASSRAGPSPWFVALQDLGDPTDFVEDATTRLATVERGAPTGRASANLHHRSTRSSAARPGVGAGAPVIPQADPRTGTPLPALGRIGVCQAAPQRLSPWTEAVA
jgi:hypothetical protein